VLGWTDWVGVAAGRAFRGGGRSGGIARAWPLIVTLEDDGHGPAGVGMGRLRKSVRALKKMVEIVFFRGALGDS